MDTKHRSSGRRITSTPIAKRRASANSINFGAWPPLNCASAVKIVGVHSVIGSVRNVTHCSPNSNKITKEPSNNSRKKTSETRSLGIGRFHCRICRVRVFYSGVDVRECVLAACVRVTNAKRFSPHTQLKSLFFCLRLLCARASATKQLLRTDTRSTSKQKGKATIRSQEKYTINSEPPCIAH